MRRWILGLSAAAACVGLLYLVRKYPVSQTGGLFGASGSDQVEESSASHVAPTSPDGKAPRPETSASAAGFAGAPSALAGLDLLHIAFDDEGTTAPLPNQGVARLSLDPELQRMANSLLASRHLPLAAVVMVDPTTGHVLAYASHVESGPARDLCAEASAPAASVFKIVTGTALVDAEGLGPDARECYAGGGMQRIHALDLEDNPRRDRWCITLSDAMGKSINPVFARLALRRLKPKSLEEAALAYGFGQKVPFDVDVQPSSLELPPEPLEYARTAAGFFHTTLSPMQAAAISTTLARGGEAVRLRIVREAMDGEGKPIFAEPEKPSLRRIMKPETAQAVATMMEHTITEGTSYRAFRDGAGRPFLRGIAVAGKTGTLSDHESGRLFTWFTGFAPSRPVANVKPVAIATLVVNDPAWSIKANVVAREMLRTYFAQQGVEHVSRPGVATAGNPRRTPKPATGPSRREHAKTAAQPVLSAMASSRPRTSRR
ncbi:penicillin-binding protein [Pendulispora rubella]|uniref:Penicillin-binding protein n=1 Tax=Pendulispora rubella TaxID=2741070 RepID=A0ABZ2L0N8_9BACT